MGGRGWPQQRSGSQATREETTGDLQQEILMGDMQGLAIYSRPAAAPSVSQSTRRRPQDIMMGHRDSSSQATRRETGGDHDGMKSHAINLNTISFQSQELLSSNPEFERRPQVIYDIENTSGIASKKNKSE